jgi:predicted ATPase
MIREIHVSNFKSIDKLDMEFGRVNVLIGANGCGKTNILEAICLGGAALAGKLDNEFLAPRGIRYAEPLTMRAGFTKKDLKKPIKMRLVSEQGVALEFALGTPATPFAVFDLLKIPKVLLPPGVEALKDMIPADQRHDADTHFSMHVRQGRFPDLEAVREQYESGYVASTYFGNLESFLIYAPDPFALRRLEDEARTLPLGTRGDGLFRLLATFSPEQMKQVKEFLHVIDWFDDFEIQPATLPGERRLRIKDQYLADGLVYFEQRAANEGFLFLLFYLCLFISEYTPAFFAIDNLDNGLNPKLCTYLCQTLCQLATKHKKQAIITTHNPAVLDGLDLKDDEQRLFVVYRNVEGRTRMRRIVPKDLPHGGPPVRLSEAFLRGYIGGLPKNF